MMRSPQQILGSALGVAFAATVAWALPSLASASLRAHHVLHTEHTSEDSQTYLYVIDTHSKAKELRDAARATWLQWATALGHEYRFFMFGDVNDPWSGAIDEHLQAEMREFNDIVIIDRNQMPWLSMQLHGDAVGRTTDVRALEDVKARQGNLLRAAFSWVVKQTTATTIVKVDHDGFVCPHHLACARKGLPSKRLFWGAFWDAGQRWCRADQNFQVVSRDVLEDAISIFDNSTDWDPTTNWARGNFAKLVRFWWGQDMLTVIDDRKLLETQQCWHTTHKFQHFRESLADEFSSFCRDYVFLHVWPKKDVNVMYELFRHQPLLSESKNLQCTAKDFSENFAGHPPPDCMTSDTWNPKQNCTSWQVC